MFYAYFFVLTFILNYSAVLVLYASNYSFILLFLLFNFIEKTVFSVFIGCVIFDPIYVRFLFYYNLLRPLYDLSLAIWI